MSIFTWPCRVLTYIKTEIAHDKLFNDEIYLSYFLLCKNRQKPLGCVRLCIGNLCNNKIKKDAGHLNFPSLRCKGYWERIQKRHPLVTHYKQRKLPLSHSPFEKRDRTLWSADNLFHRELEAVFKMKKQKQNSLRLSSFGVDFDSASQTDCTLLQEDTVGNICSDNNLNNSMNAGRFLKNVFSLRHYTQTHCAYTFFQNSFLQLLNFHVFDHNKSV